MKVVKVCALLALMTVIGALAGCHKEEKGELNPLYAVGCVTKAVDDNNNYNFRGVAVLGPMIPHVTINNDTIPWHLSLEDGEETPGTYWDSVPLTNGAKYDLKVDFHEYGTLEASATLPGVFSITPSGTYYIPVGSGFNATWTQADEADWYAIDFYFYYNGYDSDSGWYYHHVDTSFIAISSTSFSMSASRLFPYIPDSIYYSGGHFSVAAVNGPIPQPGSYGNVTGDGYGFFLGAYFPEETYIEIPGTTYKEQEHKNRADAFFKLLKKLLPNQ